MRVDPAHAPDNLQRLAWRALAQMRSSWREGRHVQTESILVHSPQLLQDKELVLEILCEEIVLGKASGKAVQCTDYVERFPRWEQEIRGIFAELNRPPAARQSGLFLVPGERLGDYKLLMELGRGAEGRVFLATQETLGDRPVVLKVNRGATGEHLSLARLQHTNIVPLYGVHDYPEQDMRVLCMPYMGGITWFHIEGMLADVPLTQRTGRNLVEVVEKAEAERPVVLPAKKSLQEQLNQSTYVEAVCWMGACLAETLTYAHERGLIHLDIKPANVLITLDGQPLLLDFHLARAPLAAGEPAPEWLGGTPGYMAPEQEAALSAVRAEENLRQPVDERADVYSLGVCLYEALGGELPTPDQKPLHELNPQVSLGLSDVIAKCLQPNPEDRYPSAAALALDLRRHLEHLPLRGVPNRSFKESWRKWRRRRPHTLPILLLVAGLALVSGMVWFMTVSRWHQNRQRAEAALFDGQDQLRAGRPDEAIKVFAAGLKELEGAPREPQLVMGLQDHLQLAKRSKKAEDLSEFAGSLRSAQGSEALMPRRMLYVLDAGCEEKWNDRPLLLTSKIPLAAVVEQRLREDLWTVALSWGQIRLARAGPDELPAAKQHVLRVLDEADRDLGKNPQAEELRRRAAGK